MNVAGAVAQPSSQFAPLQRSVVQHEMQFEATPIGDRAVIQTLVGMGGCASNGNKATDI